MRKIIALQAFLAGILFFGCTKVENNINKTKLPLSQLATASTTGYCYSCGIIDNMPTVIYGGDTVDHPTILGMQHVNPYLLPNIQTAYRNLGLFSVTPAVNNLYVRFLPNSGQQLATLDSIMELQGLTVYDTPIDYDVIQEGDYYQDPTIPIEQVTYQYAVVPVNFQFPTGVAYTILSQIHIPDDAYTVVETEAERLASIQDSLNNLPAPIAKAVTPSSVPCVGPACSCVYPCGWDPVNKTCVCCPAGYVYNGTTCVPTCQSGYWNGSACVMPPQAPDASIPAGKIKVHDTNLNNDIGVRALKVTARRWFKIERLYTDQNGNFTATKHFKHKVKISVKYINNFARIQAVRGIRLWQMYFPVVHTIGVYSSDKNNINYTYLQNGGSSSVYTNSIGNRYWACASVTNAIQEHRDYATLYGFSLPPTGLSIMLNCWGISEGMSSAPLFRVRSTSINMNNDFIGVFVGNGGSLTPFNVPNMDIIMNYYSSRDHFTSDFICRTIYHELSHTSHYVSVGTSWYSNFVASIVSEIGRMKALGLGNRIPYGDGTNNASTIIAVGESWGYHMGLFLANQKYNAGAAAKGDAWVSLQDLSLAESDGQILEDFQPKFTADVFHWIPKGLMLDLMDDTPNEFYVNDQVKGFTIQQIFSALQNDVGSVSQYKNKLIQLYGVSQQNQLNALFASYYY